MHRNLLSRCGTTLRQWREFVAKGWMKTIGSPEPCSSTSMTPAGIPTSLTFDHRLRLGRLRHALAVVPREIGLHDDGPPAYVEGTGASLDMPRRHGAKEVRLRLDSRRQRPFRQVERSAHRAQRV